MGIENPKMPPSENVAKIEEQKTLSDTELLKDGAKYVFDEKGNRRLEVTSEQVDSAKEKMKKELSNKKELEFKELSGIRGIFVIPEGESWVIDGAMGNIAVLPGAKLELRGSFRGNIFQGEGAIIDSSKAQIQGRIITGEAAKKPIEDLSGIKQKEQQPVKNEGLEIQKKLEKTEKEPNIEEKISRAENFDELYTVLKTIKTIQGSNRSYNPEEIIGIVEELRAAKRGNRTSQYDIFSVTRTLGLRQKVNELMTKKFDQH